jgi:trigger factor
VDAVLGRHEFAVPDALVMRQVAHQIEHTREGLRRQGVDPERVPWDYGKMITELKPAAERSVRRALLLEAIAEREGLAPGEPDVEAELEKIAQASQRPLPAIRRMMEKSGDLEALRHGVRDRLTLDMLVSHAKITG